MATEIGEVEKHSWQNLNSRSSPHIESKNYLLGFLINKLTNYHSVQYPDNL